MTLKHCGENNYSGKESDHGKNMGERLDKPKIRS